jgi:glucan phosphoethanolaminetransferase (alkaline phosphatase superfamily)
VAGALLEGAVLAGVLAGFLLVYVQRFAAPAACVAPHAGLVLAGALAVACLRMAAHRLAPRAGRGLGTALLALSAATLLAYYALVLVGLANWGRVITWRLIHTYARQAGDLLAVVGVPPALGLLAGAGAALALAAVCNAWLRRCDWTAVAARRLSGAAMVLVCVGGIGVAAAKVGALADQGWAAQGEPVSLTFFPERAAEATQGHVLEGNRVLEAADRAARASYRPAATARRPNVILIVGDALRGDHMQVNGYARPTTPFLQSLDDAGRLRKAATVRSVCSESTCGLLAIARSAYVHQMTPASFPLLEVMKRHGYRTHMILGGDHVNFYDLRAAYGPVDDYFDGSMAAARYMNDDRFVVERIAQAGPWDGTPQFFQLHLMSTHGAGLRFEPGRYAPARNYYAALRRPAAESGISDAVAVNYYDNGMLQFDAVVRMALQRFEEGGYLSDAIVVITGDHGEMLGEDGEYAHAQSVQEGALAIPFLMAGYGRTPAAWQPRALASQIDIAPTLLAELGFPVPASWHGIALQKPGPRDFVHFQQGLRVGVYDVRSAPEVWKYWRDLASGEEFTRRIAGGGAHDGDAATIDPRRLDELRLQALPAGASAAAPR